MKRLFSLLFCCAASVQQVYSQGVDPKKVVAPPSTPEVYSLFKASQIPVGHFTGSANVTVPLHTINLRNFAWPISLSYATTGIKVEEMASSAGLGWTLNATGTISQTVYGNNDLEYNGFPSVGDKLNEVNAFDPLSEPIYYGDSSDHWKYNIYRKVAESEVDWQPDVFFYNIGAQSGKFFFDQSGQAHTIPLTQLKISGRDSLVIYDENGNRFEFDEADTYENGSCYDMNLSGTKYLTKITTPKGDWITFDYLNVTYSFQTLNSEMKAVKLFGAEFTGDNPIKEACPYVTTTAYTKTISKITSSRGDVVRFFYDSDTRSDLPGAPRLTSVEVKYNDRELVKKYLLQQGYFGNTAVSTACRLKLNGVVQESTSGRQQPVYIFSYDETIPMPDRLSKAQDLWGFYNGKTSNPSLIPWNPDFFHQGGDRSVQFNYAKAGSLKKVTYPTGGFTQFEYEPNDFYTTNYQVDSFSFYTSPQYNSLPNGVATFTITIPANAKKIMAVKHFDNCPESLDAQENCTIVVSGNGQYYEWDCSSVAIEEEVVNLPAGTYQLTISCNSDVVGGFFQIKYFLDHSYTFTGNRICGGLRIKQTANFTDSSTTPLINKYKYRLFSDSTISSGVSGPAPSFRYHYSIYKWWSVVGYVGHDGEGASANDQFSLKETRYDMLRSNSVLPITNMSGNFAAYTEVSESIGEGYAMGKTEFKYAFTGDDGGDYGFPAPPRGTNEWKRGQLVQRKTFRYNESVKGLEPVMLEENFYSERPYSEFWNKLYPGSTTIMDEYKGLSLLVQYKASELWYNGEFKQPAQFTIGAYRLHSKWYRLDSTRTTTFAFGNLQHISRNYFTSANHIFPTSEEFFTSSGDVKEQLFTYPLDYKGQPIFDALIAANRLATPVRTVEQLNSNQQLSITNVGYENWSNGMVDLKKISKALRTAPLVDELLIEAYDEKGNIRQFITRDGLTNCYIWGYNKEYPVAKVTGASYAATIALLDTSILNNPESDVQLRTELNKLRQNLVGALITSYTYQPLVGLTSETDINDYTRFYSYDDFGRLALVKDHNGNILKKYCYNYFGQVDDCGSKVYRSEAKNGTFTKVCSDGGQGSSVTYTVAAATYTSTISQEDADQKAQNDVAQNGQVYANSVGVCTWWNDVQSGTYTKNNCPTGGTGSQLTYTVAAGSYSSMISKIDANQKALNDVSSYGQAYVNNNGTCTFYNARRITSIQKNDCPAGYTGSYVNYVVEPGKFSSTISQADADQKAISYTNQNGQAYANQYGSCISNCGTCTAVDRKCVNNYCETGIKVYTSSMQVGNQWYCEYHYEWSDGTWSQDYQEYSSNDCLPGGI